MPQHKRTLQVQDTLVEQAELASHQLNIVSTFRTKDEHKLILANQKHHKSLHNLPQAYHNTLSLTNKRDTADGLRENLVDDETKHIPSTPISNTFVKTIEGHIEQLKETVFPYTNPYAELKQLSDVEYYKQNAEVYLKEYLLIQQKQSKLSSTKRRQIVHIVETYLLT